MLPVWSTVTFIVGNVDWTKEGITLLKDPWKLIGSVPTNKALLDVMFKVKVNISCVILSCKYVNKKVVFILYQNL